MHSPLQPYRIFQDNHTYHALAPSFKQSIQLNRIRDISAVVKAVRGIVRFGAVGVLAVLRKEFPGLVEEVDGLRLSEYSQLLAMRFVRQAYFEFNYFFMNCIQIELVSTLLGIALFKEESQDEERGRLMFQSGDTLFRDGKEQCVSREVSRELQVIGFSIHKIVLEIFYTCGQTTHFLPLHQGLLTQKDEAIRQKMENSMYKAYMKLKQQNVKFPSKFHYFKQDHVEKYMAVYKKINPQDCIKKYLQIFTTVWKNIAKVLSPQSFQNPHLNNFFIFFPKSLDAELIAQLSFCQKIALETFDRYLWKGLLEFIQSKLQQVKGIIDFQLLGQDELRRILCIFLFLLFFTYHLLQPQIMYLIQRQFIEELVRIFIIVLKFYGKVSQQKGNSSLKSKARRSIEGNINVCSSLRIILQCFGRIKQFSVQFTHQLNTKGHTAHSFLRVTHYCNLILRIKPKKLNESSHVQSSQVQKEIMNRMSANHDLYFKKQQFLFLFYQKHNGHHFDQLHQHLQSQIQSILYQYSQYIQIQMPVEVQPLVEYIDLQDQEISKEQLESINKMHKEDVTLLKRLSYCLKKNENDQQFMDQQQTVPPIKNSFMISKAPTNGKIPSFLQSLKIAINRPNDVLVKSLSSSKKLSSAPKMSAQKLRESYRSSEHIGKSETSLALQMKTNSLYSTFREAVVDHEVPLKQSHSTPIKKGSRIRNIIANKYINNFVKDDIVNAEPSKIEEKLQQQGSLLILRHLQSKQCKPTVHRANVSRKQIDSAKSIKQQSMSEICFYFSGKLKKQLLKKKVLLKKNACVQMGMVANLQEEMAANARSKYKLFLKVCITARIPLLRVNVHIKFPPWLQCASKGNMQKEDMKEQTQLISNFVLQLKHHKERFVKINYSQLPLLNVVCLHKNEKREVFCESLPIMLNRFSIQKVLSQSEMYEIMDEINTFEGERVPEKIGTNLSHLKHYYANLSTFHLDPSEKLKLFSSREGVVGDQLATIKLQFVNNHKEIAIIFFQSTEIHQEGTRLFAQLFPMKRQQWGYEQLHTFSTCLRSILYDK